MNKINELKVGNRCALKEPIRSYKYLLQDLDSNLFWEYGIKISDGWTGFTVLFINKDYVIAYDRAYNNSIILNYNEHFIQESDE